MMDDDQVGQIYACPIGYEFSLPKFPRIFIRAYCPIFRDDSREVFIRDRGIYEEYRCESCHEIHSVAVR